MGGLDHGPAQKWQDAAGLERRGQKAEPRPRGRVRSTRPRAAQWGGVWTLTLEVTGASEPRTDGTWCLFYMICG